MSGIVTSAAALSLLLTLPALVCGTRGEHRAFRLLLGPSAEKDNNATVFNPVERLRYLLASGMKRGDLIIYNRVPKSGSSTMEDHLTHLSSKLGFKTKQYVQPPRVKCPQNQLPCLTSAHPMPLKGEVEELIQFLESAAAKAGQPVFIDYHFRFLDFEAAGRKAPIYINTIRHPVTRMVSHYLYSRYGSRSYQKRKQFVTEHGDLTIPECIQLFKKCKCSYEGLQNLAGSVDCLPCTKGRCGDMFYHFNTQMMYFCPWGSPACTSKGPEALAEAKRVVQEHYEAVGVLEHMQESLEVFEATLPDLLKGISSFGDLVSRSNSRKKDSNISSEDMLELEKMASFDMEFYRFASSLLLAMHKMLADAGQLPKNQGLALR